MSKGARIFVAVIYFVLISLFGIFVAITVPYDLINKYPFEVISDSLDSKDYEKAIRLVAAYYDSDIVYTAEENGYGVVIYASAILESNEEGVDDALIKKSYSGFIYGITDTNNFIVDGDNKPLVRAFNNDNKVSEFNVINCDTDGDGEVDSVYSLTEYDYMFFSFKQEDIDYINNIVFVDNTGSSFYKISGLNLNFEESFFADVDSFVTEYNKDYNSENLTTLDKEFKEKDPTYKMINYEDVNNEKSRIITKCCIILGIYFLVAYILGDITVGKRYIIKLIKKIISVIKKKKGKEESDTQIEATYNDYYTQVTIKLKVPETCNTSFVITYKNEKYDMEFMLTKVDNYQVTQRVHAGKYMNAWVECGDYQAINFPKEIEVKGFKKIIEIEFQRNIKEMTK